MGELAQLQSQFQSWVTADSQVYESESQSIAGVLKAGPSLDAESRLSIYRDMYPMRMQEALETDFPGVRCALGEDAFGEICHQYVQRYPSQSWTLNHLGQNFASFLRQNPKVYGRVFLAELATLEWSLCLIFDAPSPHSRILFDSPQEFFQARFRLSPTARLHRFRYPVSDYLGRIEKHPPRPRPAAEYLLLYRKGLEMGRRRLSKEGFELLWSLAAGQSPETALQRLSRKYPAITATQIQEWFRLWAELEVLEPGEKIR